MTDCYPLNLVLAVAVASATIFLGFLPAKSIRSDFFARQTMVAGLAWVLIGLISAPAVTHYHILIAAVCFGSWWHLHRGRGFNGKMWLSIASGLGISIGVVFLILTTTPLAYPRDLSDQDRSLLLASLYLGGAVIGLAYVCAVLVKNLLSGEGVTRELVRRHVSLLGLLVIARGIILFISYFVREPVRPQLIGGTLHGAVYGLPSTDLRLAVLLCGLDLVALPILMFVAMRAVRLGALNRACIALIGIGVIGFLAECLARLLVI